VIRSESGDGLEIRRWPPREDDPLQAWDGADRHLIEAARADDLGPGLLLVEDAWGALAVGLTGRVQGSWGDSVLGREATAWNLEKNGLPPLPWIPSTELPTDRYTGALVRVPRSLRRLRYWLARLPEVLEPGAPIWIAGRAKEVTRRVVAAADALGPAEASLQRFKSRIVRCSYQRAPRPPEARDLQGEGVTLRVHPGVFGEEGFDEGSRLLLQLVSGEPSVVVDLGCGSGVLGIAAQSRWPDASVTFTDASFLAVASARASSSPGASFFVADAGADVPTGADLILCNPPFHAGRARTRAVAARMFGEAARILRDDGALWVVGNRHLDYHQGLRRWFGRVTVRSQHPRFTVCEARSPRRGVAEAEPPG
jgi:23S rRNA (guanine1835-N2)-methyltransferase